MSFKVGDIVRVKDYEEVVNNLSFTPEMQKYCGHYFTIKHVVGCSNMTWINEYILEGCQYYLFKESWLEDAKEVYCSQLERFVKSYTIKNTNQKEGKEMNKQEVGLTQRERIENKMEEYIYKSSVCSVNIIVPNRVVEVEFNDYYSEKVKTVCNKDDVFSLERAIYIAMAKKRFGHIYTSDGIEKKADELTYEKDYVYRVKNALKVYECQQKLAALDKEEEEIKLRQKQKRHERNERRRARRAEEATKKEEERRNEQIAIQKEAYLQAMMEFEEEKKKLESKKEEEEKQTESTKEIVKKVEKLISDAENTTEDTKENKEPEKANVIGENNKEESSENNVKEEITNKMEETESKVE